MSGRGIYVSEVEEVDLGDGPVYCARLKSHPHVTATAATADAALRSLAVVQKQFNAHRAERGVPPLKYDMPNPDTEVRPTTLTGKLHK